jgi:FKBP-type peptidyl-prolyl cis-trans isomerase SlyD
MNALAVVDDMVVGLRYTLFSDDGEVIESNVSDEPLWLIQGRGHVVPGLEDAIAGLHAGDKKEVTLPPELAFGLVDDEAYQVLAREEFPSEVDVALGLGVDLYDEEEEVVIEATVVEIDGDDIVLDFNHPLAGETLRFALEIIDVRPATQEELDHDHVHGPDTDHEH